MNTLSLCVICKNEERSIGTLLESVKGDLFDEIVVVDTGSTDSTLEILKKYNVKIEHFTWINDFSAARNYSFSKATKDYIMWMDSDDYLKEKDYHKLLELKKRLHESPIWLMTYEYAHDEKGNSICSFFRERIVKRDLNLKWEQPIHEYIPLTHSFQKTDIEIHHNKKEVNSKRNISILESIVEKNPDFARNVYYLGKEYFDEGLIDKGAELLERFVNMPDAWGENKFSAYKRLGAFYRQKENIEKSLECYHQAIKVDPLKADPYFYIGDTYLHLKQYPLAIHWFKIAASMERPKDSLDIIEPKYYTWLPNLQLCLAYNAIGDVYKAAESNERALSFKPDSPIMLSNKAIFQKSLGDGYPGSETKSVIPSDEPPVKELILPKLKGKIGWHVFDNPSFATYRIRMLNINKFLKSKGFDSEIFNPQNESSYDFIIVGKIFNQEVLESIHKWKNMGKKVFCDMNEDIIEFHIVQHIVSASDHVVCCSEKLASRIKQFNPKVTVIEDAVEYY
jgi:glycosyltransferase involved in cell wall biosynthesis